MQRYLSLFLVLVFWAMAGADIYPVEEPIVVVAEGDIAPIEEPVVVMPEVVEVVYTKADLMFEKSAKAYKSGYYQTAIELVLETIKLDQSLVDRDINSTIRYYVAIILLYLETKEYSNALEYSKKLLSTLKNTNEVGDGQLSISHYIVGICYTKILNEAKMTDSKFMDIGSNASIYFVKAIRIDKSIEETMSPYETKELLERIYQ